MNSQSWAITIIAVAVAVLGTLYFVGRREERRQAASGVETAGNSTLAAGGPGPVIAPTQQPLIQTQSDQTIQDLLPVVR